MAPKGWYHWELELEETDIVITDENPVKVDSLGKRPCISCTRAPVVLYTLGLDDMLAYNMRTGAKKKTVLLPGTMSINCCSRVPLEAEQLAWIVAEHLLMLRDEMRKWGFYDVGRNLAIGAPSPPGSIIQNDGGDEWYAVTVTSPFQMARISQTTPLGKKVASSIETILGVNPQVKVQQGTPFYNGPEMPYAVKAMQQDPGGELLPVGGRVNTALGVGSVASHSVRKAAHPLNPAKQVIIRAARPGDPAVRPPSIYGRTIPIKYAAVEESPGEQQTLQQLVKT